MTRTHANGEEAGDYFLPSGYGIPFGKQSRNSKDMQSVSRCSCLGLAGRQAGRQAGSLSSLSYIAWLWCIVLTFLTNASFCWCSTLFRLGSVSSLKEAIG